MEAQPTERQVSADRMAWVHLWLMASAVLLLAVCAASLIILVQINSVQIHLVELNKRIAAVEKRLEKVGSTP